jgi:tight adherence protein B
MPGSLYLIIVSISTVVYGICRVFIGLVYRKHHVRRLSAGRTTLALGWDSMPMALFKKSFDRLTVIHKEKVRIKTIEESLPDLLAFMISAFKASLSINQAVSEAREYFQRPLKDELEQLDADLKSGFSQTDAMNGFAERVPLPDIRFFVMVLNMHQRSGGSLLPALESLSACIRGRVSLRKEVRVMTGQSRFSAMILCLLPVCFLILMPALTGHVPFELLTSSAGCLILLSGAVLDIAAFFMMRRLTEIKTY